MKAMVIDDERLALRQLEKTLLSIGGFDTIDCFLEPALAVEQAAVIHPDVAFLDIHMPEMDGLRAAELLLERSPHTEIVFVTAYNEFAVRAFEINALDYVMKPILRERLEKTVARLRQKLGGSGIGGNEADERPAILCTMPTLRLKYRDASYQPLKWRTTKAQDLFAYALHHRGQLVRKSVLLDMLWPELDPERSYTHLYTTVYQIRQTLKRLDLNMTLRNLSVEEGYILDMGQVMLDTEHWEQELRRVGVLHAGNAEAHRRLLEAYEGDYLADYDYVWAEGERERLRSLWLKQARGLAVHYAEHGQHGQAAEVLRITQRMFPYLEEPYFELMKLYAVQSERKLVDEQYEALEQMAAREMGARPQALITDWYAAWKEMLHVKVGESRRPV